MHSRSSAVPETRATLDRNAALLLILLCAVWGLNQVTIKVANDGISPLLQAGFRSIGAGILVLAWCGWRRVRLTGRDGTLWAGIAAGVLFAGEFVLIYWGLNFTTASRSVLFVYTAPFFVTIGVHFLVPGDRLTRAKLVGLVAAFGGVVVAFADGLRLPSQRELIGDLMCLGGAIFWAATTVLIKASTLARIRAEKTLFYQLAVSAVLLPLASVALAEPGVFNPTPLVLGAVAYQIVVVAFASYAAWFWLVRTYPASRLSAFSFLTPVFGVALGGLLLDEPISAALASSVALIAAGIYLVNRSDAKAA